MTIKKKLLPLDQSWERVHDIDSIVFHTTLGTSALSSWNWLDHIDLSYHYIIDDDGTIYHSVEHDRAAWHAGVVSKPTNRVVSHFKGLNPNKSSIGIAFSRNRQPELTQSQIEACVELIKVNEWEDMPYFVHNEITNYKPSEVHDYLAQVEEALGGDKGDDDDFKLSLMKQVVVLMSQLLEKLKLQNA